jgi:hypothetical protein
LLDWIRVRLATPLLHAVPVVAYYVPVDHGGHVHRLATIAKPSFGFTVPLPCFFPLCLIGRVEIPTWEPQKGFQKWDGIKQRFIIQRKCLIC